MSPRSSSTVGLAELLPLTLHARGVDEERYRLVHADALQVTELSDLPHAGQPTALVANLPYNVATPILLTILERFPEIRTALVMVQSEVVDRLTARPGESDLRRAEREGRLVRPR